MTSPIQVRPHPSKHRALHATAAFTPGQIIHTFHPLILHPSLSHLSTVCTHCLRPGSPRACSHCHAAYYCNSTCQQAGWTAIHSKECKPLRLRKLGSRTGAELPAPVRTLVQALLKAEIGDAVAKLDGHAEKKRNTKSWPDLEMMAMAACAFAGKDGGEGDVRRAVELLCKIQTNAFHRWDVDLGQVGVFLEPTLAMANHSCVPNAMVQFVGRKAILRAEKDIQAGDEIEISYTDYTMPLLTRKDALLQYSFECTCARCKDDLNVYQVCEKQHNHASTFNIGDLSNLSDHPAVTDPKTRNTAAKYNSEPEQLPESLSTRQAALSSQYKAVQNLTTANLWAISPVPQVLTEISICFAERSNFPYALCIASLVASCCDPYRYTPPFHPVRVKNLFMTAKLLANTAEGPKQALSERKDSLGGKIQEALSNIDQVSLCQMLLIMVRKMSSGDLREWELCVAARDMLDDIGKLPGREKELSLIDGWDGDEMAEASRVFFEYAVVKQVDVLAELGREVLRMEFGA